MTSDSSIHAAPPRLHFSVAPEPSRLQRARERIRDYVTLHCADEAVVNDVVLAIEEACTNAIRHSGSRSAIEIFLAFEGDHLSAAVKDSGRGFDIEAFDATQLPDPLLDHGRGLYLISRLCDEMELSCDGGLEVHFLKRSVLQEAKPRAGLDRALVAAPDMIPSRGRRVRAMLEEIDEGFAALDWEYRYTYVNPAACRLLKHSEAEILGRTPCDLWPEYSGHEVERAYRAAMELGRSSIVEYETAGHHWFEERLYPTTMGLSVYFRDIDERKRRELERDGLLERLVASRETLERSQQLAHLGSWELDLVSGQLTWSDEVYRIFGLEPQEFGATYEAFLERVYPDDRETVDAAYTGSLRENLDTYEIEHRVVRKDSGEIRFVHERCDNVRDAAGKIVRSVGMVRDITERQHAEANQTLLTEVLQVLNRVGGLQSVIGDSLRVIQRATGFDAVGLRLRKGDDYPYFEHNGFTDEFVQQENFLCVLDGAGAIVTDAVGRALLECTCGLVVSGRTDQSMSCFTPGGSFWTNRSTDLLALSPKDDPRTNPRNRCIHTGFQSIGLFPVRAGEETVGLLQLNDRREGRFTPELLRFYESLAQNIGLALQRASAEESLRESEQRFRSLFAGMTEGVALHEVVYHDGRPADYRIIEVNPSFERHTGVAAQRAKGRLATELYGADEAPYLAEYARVAEGGGPYSFEVYFAPMARHFRITAVSSQPGRFATVFEDITEHKRSAAEIQLLLEQSQAQGEEFQAQSEELRVQYDEERARAATIFRQSELRAGLNAIAEMLNSTLDPDEAMRRALGEVTRVLAIDAAAIEMNEGGTWPVRYAAGLPTEALGSLLTGEPVIARLVAFSGKALVLDDAAAHETVGPFAARCGIRSLMAEPLLARDQILGVLVLAERRIARHFADAEVDFAARLGTMVGLTLENTRLYAAQSAIATTLQENFIHELPAVRGLQLGVVSRAAYDPERVGGDFSDIFVVDDTHVVVLIGDVAGKGVRAAGLTETVRSSVRALATVDPSPAFILAKANELLLRFDPDQPHVTAFCAVLDPHTGHLSYTSAGHPAPIHVGPFTARPLDVTFGPPLGSFDLPYGESHVMLTLEDYLVLYTDGLTEARRGGKLYGEARLAETLANLRGLSAQELAAGLLQEVGNYADKLTDDIQIVTLRLD